VARLGESTEHHTMETARAAARSTKLWGHSIEDGHPRMIGLSTAFIALVMGIQWSEGGGCLPSASYGTVWGCACLADRIVMET
jgi:hypothetical protein